MSGLETLSSVVGWIYFFAWSSSFYGQLITNYKMKSVEGCKLEFLVLNFTGFVFYSVYNSFGYWDKSISVGSVEINDLFFAYHAVIITTITCAQCFIYPRGKNKVHISCWIFTAVVWIVAVAYVIV